MALLTNIGEKTEAHLFNDECLWCCIVNNKVNHMQNITMTIIGVDLMILPNASITKT
jgi:hypothetical protein